MTTHVMALALSMALLAQAGQAQQSTAAAKPAAANPDVKVGNYFVDAPYGIALIVDDQTAFLIEPAWDEKGGKTSYSLHDAALVAPATTAPDFSFSTATFKHQGTTITFTWGRSGPSAVVALIAADKPVALSLRLPTTWPQFHTIYTAAPDGLTGYGVAPRGSFVPFRLSTDPVPSIVNANVTAEAEVVLSVQPARPVRLVAGVGQLPSFESVPGMLRAAGERYAAHRVGAEGDWGDFVGAIADNVNNARLYGSDNHRIAISCGRGWWLAHQKTFEGNADLYPYFLWDYFFHAVLSSLENPDASRDTIRAVLSFQTPAGFVPSFSHWGAEQNTYVTLHRSMPPVGAMAAWKLHERWPDKAFLSEIYPRLVRWHDWWLTARDGNHNGLLEWGSEQQWWQGAQYETGWDDNVHFDRTALVGTTMNADAVDLSSLWSMDAEYLARIAGAIGQAADAARFTREHEAMNRRINERLWNESLGIYCSRLWNVPDAEGPALEPARVFPRGFDVVFFRDPGFVNEAARGHDVRVDLEPGQGGFPGGLPADRWSVRWTGSLTVPSSGRYRLRIDKADRARLIVNGHVVDNWQFGDDTKAVDVTLDAAQAIPIVLEYTRFPSDDPAAVQLTVHSLAPGHAGDDWLTRLTPMNFYPLLAGVPDAKRGERVLDWLYREDKFWLPWLVPTVAKDDPVWPKQSYWHGHVWPPANYLVWLGVQRYADPAHRAEFARRSVRLFMRNWQDARLNCENYRSTDGGCGNDPHYTWGTLLPMIGVEALVSAGPDFRPVPAPGAAFSERLVLRRIPFGGRLYRIETAGGVVTVREETETGR